MYGTRVCARVKYDATRQSVSGGARSHPRDAPRTGRYRYRLGLGPVRNSRRIRAARWVSAKETRHEVTDATRRSLAFSRARGATPLSHKEEKRTPARHFSWRRSRLEQGSIWPEGGWPSMVVARRAFALSLPLYLSHSRQLSLSFALARSRISALRVSVQDIRLSVCLSMYTCVCTVSRFFSHFLFFSSTLDISLCPPSRG